MSKIILITGISGFVGNYLTRKLLQEDGDKKIVGTYLSPDSIKVFSDISEKLDLHQLDLMDSKSVEKLVGDVKPDEIYHLAAMAVSGKSFDNPALVITNNIISQVNLLEAVRIAKINPKIMITSSAEIYGKVEPQNLPIDELTPMVPANPYAVSKIAQDYMGLQYNVSYGLNIIRVRPFNHIGPGQSDQFATAAFAKKIAEIEKGKREPVLTVGSLDSKKDFTDVLDMVSAYVMLMQKGIAGEVYNIGSGKSYKMSDILNILLSFTTVKIKIETDPDLLRPSDNPELVCDNTKIHELTGWSPQIPLEKTLRDILEYWRGEIK